MDYQALKTELLAGHPVTGAYDADDALAADQLNAVNVTAQREVISASDIFETIGQAADNPGPGGCRANRPDVPYPCDVDGDVWGGNRYAHQPGCGGQRNGIPGG